MRVLPELDIIQASLIFSAVGVVPSLLGIHRVTTERLVKRILCVSLDITAALIQILIIAFMGFSLVDGKKAGGYTRRINLHCWHSHLRPEWMKNSPRLVTFESRSCMP